MPIGRPRYDNYSILLNNHTLSVDFLEIVIAKVNSIFAIIKNSFVNFDAIIFPLLYKFLVYPIFEHGNFVWGPLFVTDQ